ncbi:MAG: class I SAM-dependent methyltransferase [Planctomycetota bacterium]|jgi:ubiquinone/menaquinone biosynthesis C-methylase UbiE
MIVSRLLPLALSLFAGSGLCPLTAQQTKEASSAKSTRVEDPKQHAYEGAARYPFRAHSEYIFAELDLEAGDVVVDIGAGDGWWSERLAEFVGEKGKVLAAEVKQDLVDEMAKEYADRPWIEPYLCPFDSTGLEKDSVDMAFFAQSFHHIEKDVRVEYLKHLKDVIRPTGRICIIEKHSDIATRSADHGSFPSHLAELAEEAGWVLVRYELMPKTYHFLTVFVQEELFPAEPEGRGGRGRRRGGEGK